jgi:hypothetical protein
MLEHLEKFIFHFIKMLKQLNKYNAVWLSVPAYHNLILQNKSFEEIPQWQENAMNEMSQYLLIVATQSLRGRSPTQRP